MPIICMYSYYFYLLYFVFVLNYLIDNQLFNDTIAVHYMVVLYILLINYCYYILLKFIFVSSINQETLMIACNEFLELEEKYID